jgi:hypothetical protein
VPAGERALAGRQDGDAELLDEVRRLLSAQQVSHGILESDAAAALHAWDHKRGLDLSGTRIAACVCCA